MLDIINGILSNKKHFCGLPSEAVLKKRKMRTPPISETEPYSFESIEIDEDIANSQQNTSAPSLVASSSVASSLHTHSNVLNEQNNNCGTPTSEHIAQARAHVYAQVSVNQIQTQAEYEATRTLVHNDKSHNMPSRSIRIRQYNTSSKGPFIVFIREISSKLAPLKITKYINEHYPSTIFIKRSPGTLKVSLKCVSEANAIVGDTFFADYHVSVPADNVEVEGAIDWHDLCDLKDLKELCSIGKGVFNNSSIPNCDIVHAERLSRLDDSVTSSRNLIETNTIKVTFVGNLLPNYIYIFGLRVRVRPFFKKPMFCDKCQVFGHTIKFCRSKVRCASCAAEHSTKDCPFDNSRCPYCRRTDKHERNKCPFFAEVNESFKSKQADRRKAILRQAAAKATSDVVASSSQNQFQTHEPFPALRNRFESLPEEDIIQEFEQSDNEVNQYLPKNPYAKVVKEGLKTSTSVRMGLKRSRPIPTPKLASLSNHQKPETTDRLIATNKNKSTPSINHSNHPSDPSSALSEAIIKFAQSAGVSSVWITLLQAIIEPLLKAIMPKLSSILGNVAHDVLNQSF